jgi:hypothetical protein
MTGQGDKNYDQIKREKDFWVKPAIDVTKNFRTANGKPVRNLRIETTNKTVINGKVITTAHYRQIITGQVYTQNQWLPADWDARGRHIQEQYSLVEQKETHTQGNLF